MGFLLFLRGYGRSDADTAGRLSQFTGRSPADARLLLLAKFPKLLALHGEVDAAASELEKLQSGGFEGFLAEQDEVERPPSLAEAGKAEVEEQAVSWWHAHRRSAASPDLGEIQDRTIRQTR